MKTPYSIFSKMQRKSIGFEQLSDVFGFRVLVDKEEDCYRALGIVHTAWPMVPGRFKDYISTPKQNEYRSIHTTIIGPRRQRVELQIRTRDMDRIAEYGIAAHPLYKDGIARRPRPAGGREPRLCLAPADRRADRPGDAPEEFLEHTKLELFQDQVFCFTPKGRLIALPRGATPIDFAYAVHTDIGDTCVGAKVNGQLSPLGQPLENGDEVEIVRSAVQRPPAAWEAIVVTGKARVRDPPRQPHARRAGNMRRSAAIRSNGASSWPGSRSTAAALSSAAARLAIADVDDLLAAVGRGQVSPRRCCAEVHPGLSRRARHRGRRQTARRAGRPRAARA